MNRMALLFVALLCTLPRPAQASPINLGFETGDFSGWNVVMPFGVGEYSPGLTPAGSTNVMEEFLDSMLAVEGTHFAVIGTGNASYAPGQGSFNIYASQTLSMDAGTVLSGWSRFYNGDYEAQDSAWVTIYDSLGHVVATPWAQTSGRNPAVDYRSSTSWEEWRWEASHADTYTLAIGATTFGDNRLSSYGAHDGIKVPEPSTLYCLAGVFATLLARGRRRH